MSPARKITLITTPPQTSTSKAIVGLVVLALAIFGALWFNDLIAINHLTQGMLTDLLTGIGVVTIVVERTIEIIANVWRGQARIDLESQIEKIERLFKEAKEDSVKKQVLDSLVENIENAKFELKRYKQNTNVFAIRISLFAGIVVAIAGFRILGNLYDSTPLLQGSFQLFIFRVIDIILTAGIISGGSAGFHLLTQTFGDFFQTQRNLSQNKGQQAGSQP